MHNYFLSIFSNNRYKKKRAKWKTHFGMQNWGERNGWGMEKGFTVSLTHSLQLHIPCDDDDVWNFYQEQMRMENVFSATESVDENFHESVFGWDKNKWTEKVLDWFSN